MREYARVEGLLVELGVTSKLASDLSRGNGVSEAAEYCKKAPCNSLRPQVDFVPGGSMTDTCPTHVPRNMPQEFGFHSLLRFVSQQL